MYIKGILDSISIFLCFFLLIIALPSFILGAKVKNETIFKRFMIYLVFGNFYISSLVFVLAYFGIFTRSILIFSLVFLSLGIWLLLNRQALKTKGPAIKALISDVIVGKYGTRLFFLRLRKCLVGKMKGFVRSLFKGKKMEWAIFLPIIGYNIYQYNINNIEFLTYMAPDEEVHLYWVQSLISGDLFPRGVYPHVFHNVLGATTKLFNFDAFIFLKYFGPTAALLIMLMLYFGLRKIFTTKYPALFGLMMYSILNVYGEQVTYRFQFVIPQEYAMMMLMPMAIFLLDYIQEKKILDLIFFALSFSLMIGIHFYTAIIGAVLILAIGLVYLYKIFKDKLFLKLLLSGILSIIVALAPLGIGLALGYEVEQSMDWAQEVIRGDIYTSSETVAPSIGAIEDELVKYAVNDVGVFYVILGVMVFAILFNLIFIILKRGDPKNRYQIAFALNSFFLGFLMVLRVLDLPTIMEPKRVAIYFAYFASIWMGMPLEVLARLAPKPGARKRLSVLSFGVMGLSLFGVIQLGYLRPNPPFYYFQPTGTMVANMKIIEEYEDYTWTAVSPVNNMSQVLNNGFHYELTDFIMMQENWNRKKELWIPTEYVFVYIEKRPLEKIGFRFYKDELDIKNRDLVTYETALMEFTKGKKDVYYYEKERPILMAKAYYWAQEYKKYFPNEMNVYYEDEELIIYRIRQNPYALTNFNIDYHVNSR